jgi:hypothetical protein
MVSRKWARTPKLLVFSGLFAVAFASFASKPSVVTTHDAADTYYPGPCTNAPQNVTITFRGAVSGCTESNGRACQPGEVIEFTANSPSRTFQVCDTFTWVFGDDPDHPVTTLWPTITRQFTGNTARTVRLNVANSFASTGINAATVNVPPNTATSCSAGANVLCFVNNRYRVTLDASDTARTGKTGTGEANTETADTGFFTLSSLTSSTQNPEVVVKVLEIAPGQPWVFFGGMTDLEYFVNVLDTTTGQLRQYHKFPGTVQGGFDTGGGQAPTPDTSVNAPGACPSTPPVVNSTTAVGTCTPGTNTMCLVGNRFKIEVTAKDPRTLNSGPGVVRTRAGNDVFGYFSVPALTGNPNNQEIFLKMLDARTLNGKFWVFFGTLSDFEFTVRVTDVTTGQVRTYTRAGGTACGATDTSALPF